MTPSWPQTGVLVLGLGRSGAAAARALLAVEVGRLVVADRDDGPALRARADELRAAGADVRLGADDPGLLEGVGLVVPSPGVPQSSPLLATALGGRVPVWSEPELAWRLSSGRTRLVAVTGTNGKTTTTELVAACLGVPAAGNIGTPLSDVLTATDPPPLVCAELSSFQLRFTDALRADVAVLLNVAADHLDWHGSPEAYRAAKARVWANQRPGDRAVVNADDVGAVATMRARPPRAAPATFTVGPPAHGQVGVERGWVVDRLAGAPRRVAPVGALGLRGPHNLSNAAAAVAAARCAGAPVGSLRAPLSAFAPGPHRHELVATVAGVRFVDDSKATNPHAASAALTAFSRPPAAGGAPAGPSIVWIAGGLNKGLSFDELAAVVPGRVRAAVTIGSSGPALARLTRRLGVRTVEAGDLAAAVPAAAALAAPGDTVLLAPACASMDQFRDYAARGQAFRHAVERLTDASREEVPHGA
ncbi:MAG: UDP-N-acetylmuramoyl-L-alanine--D-glutamate ligase [Actinobacteria bacterium]|nr:UDP-N-acetylmuramoyl-L-alanine--D-glutamate ligase [Actinomycetota bacterium]